MSKIIKVMVICCGIYLAMAPINYIISDSIHNIITNNGKNISRMV